MEKFNLEKALNGAKVVTRSGKIVESIELFDGFMLVKVHGSGCKGEIYFRMDGRISESVDTDADLFLYSDDDPNIEEYKNALKVFIAELEAQRNEGEAKALYFNRMIEIFTRRLELNIKATEIQEERLRLARKQLEKYNN